ncbi:tigger transposable element-derived protein 1-like [Watersipora subatra]|uniref:tigger transposable element-derived protein 1-like n=1 Tax=Watersipora subatra TaxID=2589382 RepID=UPI00355AD7AD
MSKKCFVPAKRPPDTPKRLRKMLTIAEKVTLLDMLKEGKSYAAVGRHYGINESSVRYIKKVENNIRMTSAISFNKYAKRVVTVRNKAIIRMESALALWINDCRKKSITLDTSVICTKAKKPYETFAGSDVLHDSKREGDTDLRPSTSAVHALSSTFNASKGWFEKFQKRFGLKNISLHGKVASVNTAGAVEYVSNKFKAIIEEGGYKPEKVFNMDETALFWKNIPSHTFIMQEEAKALGFKAQKYCVTLVMCGNAAGFTIKPGLIYKSKNPRALKNKNKDALLVY